MIDIKSTLLSFLLNTGIFVTLFSILLYNDYYGMKTGTDLVLVNKDTHTSYTCYYNSIDCICNNDGSNCVVNCSSYLSTILRNQTNCKNINGLFLSGIKIS